MDQKSLEELAKLLVEAEKKGEATPSMTKFYEACLNSLRDNDMAYNAAKLEVQRLFGSAENMAIQSVIMINGAAAIAVLAFIGSIWAFEILDDISDLLHALYWLVAGVGIGFISCLINYILYHFSMKAQQVEDQVQQKKYIVIVNRITIGIVFLLFCGFSCFAYGTYKASEAFHEPRGNTEATTTQNTAEALTAISDKVSKVTPEQAGDNK